MKNESSPKKLLIIVNALSMGGAEHMIYELVKFIDRDKFSPTILCYGKHQENPLESKVSQVCDVKYVGITRKIGIAEMRKVFSLIKEISPDIIHAHQGGVSFAVPWCALHRTPLCITVHSNPHKAFSKNNNCMIKLFKKTLNLMLVAVSKENLSLVQEYYKLDDKKSIYINNGIDIHRFYKNKENDKFTFINVARQDENKNQSAILRAISKFSKEGRNVRLILAGDGPCNEKLKSEAESLGISDVVDFTGQVSDPAKYYAQSDVYVQTSFREALPLSVLEAMACGLPVIATNVGGLKDVVDKNGFLINAGDDENLFLSMSKLMDSSKSEYELMSNASKHKVESYSSDRMAQQYEDVYDRLLSKRKQ